MVSDNRNGLILRTGLSLVAALMLSGAACAGQATATTGAIRVQPVFDRDLITVDVGPQTMHEINPGSTDQGVATGEPDPNGGAGDQTGDGGTGGDPTAGDGTGDGSGDQATGDGTGDGGGDQATGDGTGGDPSAVDGSGDGSGDQAVGDQTGGDPSALDSGDGSVTVDNMGGIFQNTADPVMQPQLAGNSHPVAAPPSQNLAHSAHEGAGQPLAHSGAACLAQHPGLTWMCEWQNGAGQ